MWATHSLTMNGSLDAISLNRTSSSSPTFESFCQHLQTIGGTYNLAHGYASLTVCVFGTLANILNLIILTRKEMVNSTNIILTGLALADLLTTLEYVPYAIYTDFLPDPVNGGRRKTYPWALYVLIHSNFSQVCHTTAIWLTVTVAAWRYLMISMPLQCRTLCSMARAKKVLVLAYVISPLLCLPIYLTFSIRTIPATDQGIQTPNVPVILRYYSKNFTETFTPSPSPADSSKYIVNLSDLARNNQIIVTINFWVYSVVIKIIPCILLTVVSLRLIKSLLKVKKRKKMLLLGIPSSNQSNSIRGVTPANSQRRSHCPCPQLTTATEQVSSVFMTTEEPTTQITLLRQQRNPEPCSSRTMAETSFTLSVFPEPEISTHLTVPCSSGGRCKSSAGEICLTKRTTKMLLTVLVLFLVTEFPQGILALFSDLMGDDFFKRCYIPMANLMDFLALFNAALNFVLYFVTSIRFRNTLRRLLKKTRGFCCVIFCWSIENRR